jgi:F-type H+-transporting ATPase subunit delta
MKRDIAAKRYAEAVFQIARDQQNLNVWRADVRRIGTVFSDPEVIAVLENTRVPWETKDELLVRSLVGVLPLALNYARLLVLRRRERLAMQVADYFDDLVDDFLGVAKAEVITAVEIDENEKRLIAEQLSRITRKQVSVQVSIDPSIIGGFVARVGDKLIDGSTKTRLLVMRRRLEVAR